MQFSGNIMTTITAAPLFSGQPSCNNGYTYGAQTNSAVTSLTQKAPVVPETNSYLTPVPQTETPNYNRLYSNSQGHYTRQNKQQPSDSFLTMLFDNDNNEHV